MLIKLLSEPEQTLLLGLAELLTLSDNPLLWDGKKYEEITSCTDLSELSIQISEQEEELITDLLRLAGHDEESSYFIGDIKEFLEDQLKTYPLHKQELAETRMEVAQAVLNLILEENSISRPEAQKIMLFEMFLVALRDGAISPIEQELLKAFQRHYKLEDFIFDELLERAEALNAEVSKTIALVLE